MSNELRIHKLDRKIASMKVDTVTISYSLEEWRERHRLANILTEFAGNRVHPETIDMLTHAVYKSSKQFGYDPVLLLAVIHVESFFNPEAYGKYKSGALSGALGLMQLKPETAMRMAKALGMTITREEMMRPEVNMVLGVAYLTQLITRFKSFKLALLAYNQGPATVLQSLSNREPLSINYYSKVLKSYYRLKKIAEETGKNSKF